MKHCAHLWARMFLEMQREILQIPFQAVEDGRQEAKTPVARHAAELAEEEHHRVHTELWHQAEGLHISVFEEETITRTLESQMREAQACFGASQLQRSTTAASESANREHRSVAA